MCHNKRMAKRKAVKTIITPPTKPAPSLFSLFVKSFALAFLFAFILLSITAAAVLAFAFKKSLLFTNTAQTSLPEIINEAVIGWNTSPQQDQGRVNFLVLGSDELPNRPHDSVLTDTLLIASLNLKTAQIGLYSFPRDIWIPTYQEKINKLYESGKELNPANPQDLPKNVIQDLTGIPIHHTIIIKLDTLSKLVDLVGGVDVQVKESFTDPLFPRSDVDVTKVHDPKLLYETVSFASGSAHMSGSDVLKYVRSRHAIGDQGSDNARGSRQQDVILAMIQKFKHVSFWYDLARDGQMYHFYKTEFSSYLSIPDAISIGRVIRPHLNNLQFSEGTPAVFPTDSDGVIFHPEGNAAKYYGAWVYEIKDAQLFKEDARKALHYSE